MPSTGFRMEKCEHPNLIIIGYTHSHQLVRTVFKQIWVVKIIFLNVHQKFLLLLRGPLGWNLTCHQIIDYVRIPWAVYKRKSCSSGKLSPMGKPWEVDSGINRDNWSATTFSTPFLSLLVRLNSWHSRIHLVKRGLVSCFDSKYFSSA